VLKPEPRNVLLQTTVEMSLANALKVRAREADRSVAAELRLILRAALVANGQEKAA
jgi:plasmid stability protein